MENFEEGTDVLSRSLDLFNVLCEVDSVQGDRKKVILEYIDQFEDRKCPSFPGFNRNLEWINTSRPLAVEEDFKGRIVVLDFFTYCCINCMHILPDLEALEKQHGEKDGVFVVGIHSAKFENEKLLSNILSAVLRYGIHHPVVNDHTAFLWQQLQVQCWPTLMILGPNNQILLSLMGEGNRDLLIEFVGIALEYYGNKGLIKPIELPLDLAKHHARPSVLSFPGKIALNGQDGRVAVSEIGHHRVLILDKMGVVQHVIGGDTAGFQDGSFPDAKFHSPEGLEWHNDILFVADTDNHAIRKIDLKNREVTTIAGTGQQGDDKEGGGVGTQQPITSPWDIVLGKSIGSDIHDLLFIAMAGTHQIWILFLEDAKWIKNSDFKKGTCIRFAGSGTEENRNNSYPQRAGFAQPSGLTSMHGDSGDFLYEADSESSSIRVISLKDGAVKALVGGERDPTNLFASGDADGKAYDVRLQHPLGVATLGSAQDTLLVADSYNHKIKEIKIKTKECTTLVGTGQHGDLCGTFEETKFNEPGGLACAQDGTKVYVADTNNHKIKVVDLVEKSVSELVILMPSMTDEVDAETKEPATWKRLTPKNATIINCKPVLVSSSTDFDVVISLNLPEGSNLTSGAPSSWQLWNEDNALAHFLSNNTNVRGRITEANEPVRINFKVPESLENKRHDVLVECMVYHCNTEGLCKMAALVFKQPIDFVSSDTDSGATTNECIIHHVVQ